MHDFHSSRTFALLVFALMVLFAGGAKAAPPLFPEPLHLTRIVETPFGGKTAIEEYCHGNRIVSVFEQNTIIIDYDKQTVTEISRTSGTYSITPFSDVAAATAGVAKRAPRQASKTSAQNDFEIRETAAPAGRTRGRYFAVEPKAHRHIRKMEVGVDSSIGLSREAIEALLGASFPNSPTDEADIALRAAAADRGQRGPTPKTQSTGARSATDATLGLPLEQTITYDAGGGKEFVVSNRVTRVGNELPPASLTAIPPGARAVESHFVRTRRELEELDKLSPNQ